MALTGQADPSAPASGACVEALRRLLADEPLESVLDAATQFVVGRHAGLACTITAADSSDRRFVVGSELPAALSGLAPPAGSPWALAIASRTRQRASATTIDPVIATQAVALGLADLTVVPFVDDAANVSLLTLWTMRDGPPVSTLDEIVDTLSVVVGVVLRFQRQTRALEHAVTHDGLTGLTNRAAFLDRLRSQDATRHGEALFYLGLDAFKPVNDQFGQTVGDAVLNVVGERLAAAVRPGDVVARLGGDEFAVMCHECGPDEARVIADRLRSAVTQPVRVGDLRVGVGVSVGVAHSREPDPDDQALERAREALMRAKRNGRNRVEVAVDETAV